MKPPRYKFPPADTHPASAYSCLLGLAYSCLLLPLSAYSCLLPPTPANYCLPPHTILLPTYVPLFSHPPAQVNLPAPANRGIPTGSRSTAVNLRKMEDWQDGLRGPLRGNTLPPFRKVGMVWAFHPHLPGRNMLDAAYRGFPRERTSSLPARASIPASLLPYRSPFLTTPAGEHSCRSTMAVPASTGGPIHSLNAGSAPAKMARLTYASSPAKNLLPAD